MLRPGFEEGTDGRFGGLYKIKISWSSLPVSHLCLDMPCVAVSSIIRDSESQSDYRDGLSPENSGARLWVTWKTGLWLPHLPDSSSTVTPVPATPTPPHPGDHLSGFGLHHILNSYPPSFSQEGVWFRDLGCVFKWQCSIFGSDVMAQVTVFTPVLVPEDGRSSEAWVVGCSAKTIREGLTSQLSFSTKDIIKPLLCQYF